MKKVCPVVHFEMPASDSKRMAEFYATVFGWKPIFLGPEMGNYVVVETTESSKDGRPTTPGAINGGFFKRDEQLGQTHPSVVIAVEDIVIAAADVQGAGGNCLMNQWTYQA